MRVVHGGLLIHEENAKRERRRMCESRTAGAECEQTNDDRRNTTPTSHPIPCFAPRPLSQMADRGADAAKSRRLLLLTSL